MGIEVTLLTEFFSGSIAAQVFVQSLPVPDNGKTYFVKVLHNTEKVLMQLIFRNLNVSGE